MPCKGMEDFRIFIAIVVRVCANNLAVVCGGYKDDSCFKNQHYMGHGLLDSILGSYSCLKIQAKDFNSEKPAAKENRRWVQDRSCLLFLCFKCEFTLGMHYCTRSSSFFIAAAQLRVTERCRAESRTRDLPCSRQARYPVIYTTHNTLCNVHPITRGGWFRFLRLHVKSGVHFTYILPGTAFRNHY